MRTLPCDVARCLSKNCKSKHLCLRWMQNGGGNMLWYGNFEVELQDDAIRCPYFIGE